MKFKLYRCPHCGNIIVKLVDGKAKPICCGAVMEELKPNTTDAATEKHVPVVTKTAGEVKVVVGSALHPMTEQHYIAFIALVTNLGVKINHLKPTDAPETTFAIAKGERVKEVYEFCTLHGLWKTK